MNNSAQIKPGVTLSGVVEKIIPGFHPSQPEQAQIAVDGAAQLYKEIRIENKLRDQDGNDVMMKEGTQVEVTVKAEPDETTNRVPQMTP